MSARAAYIHVPFCHHRCPYCNFTVAVDREDWIERYLHAIEVELSFLRSPRLVDTIFLGGGTPTLLSPKQLERLFSALQDWLPISGSGEWTIEANPDDITNERCGLLREAGINRISIGGQSFDDRKLIRLGRHHRGDGLQTAIDLALNHFPAVSLDLIFGVPDETIDVWVNDLQRAVTCGIQHLSTYGLTYEKGAAFWGLREKGILRDIPEDIELQMYYAAIDFLARHGFEHYEVSNFAKSGFACRHNQAYWSLDPWFAFGPGAAAFVDGVRTVNHRSTSRYLQLIETGQSPIAESETIDDEQLTLEKFVFGMRRLAGVDIAIVEREGVAKSVEKIKRNVADHIVHGWMESIGTRVKLTRAGLAISDSLWPAYLSD